MGRYLQTNAGDYYKEPEPPKTRIPHGPSEFAELTYRQRLQLKQEHPKIYDCYTKKINKKWPWER